MSIRKHKEFLEHLFTDILNIPMMSEYHPEHTQIQCNTQHLGGCRHLCYTCSGTKYTLVAPFSDMVKTGHTNNCIPHCSRPKAVRTPEALLTIGKGLHAWYELDVEPECNSCKYAVEWKRRNWVKYMEKAIRGGTKERKDLRKIFHRNYERLVVRKLLAFFNCNTTIQMRDSLSGVIDYMYPTYT